MKRLKLAGPGLALLAGLVAGCSTKVEVKSNTSWTGNVNGGTVAGRGDKTYSIGAGECAVFQKDTEAGGLGAAVKGWHEGTSAYTEAPYGVVSVCASR